MFNRPGAPSIREFAVPFSALFVFWLVLMPDRTTGGVVVGAVVCAGTVVFCRRILFRRSEFPLYSLRALHLYALLLAILGVEIFKSNVSIAWTVLQPKLSIQPQFATVDVHDLSEFNRVVLANCITLTPGTLSVTVEPDYIRVHALTDAAAADLQDHFALGILRRIEEVNSL
ncbi:MAG: Na+/H+ antiporter subunit E [bacterium]